MDFQAVFTDKVSAAGYSAVFYGAPQESEIKALSNKEEADVQEKENQLRGVPEIGPGFIQ